MRSDWASNRDEFMAFWKTGLYTTLDTLPDSLPWLFVAGSPDSLPWAARQFD